MCFVTQVEDKKASSDHGSRRGSSKDRESKEDKGEKNKKENSTSGGQVSS